MHFTKKNSSQKREELKKKLKKQKILKFPGAYNPLTAKLIAEIGFDGVYISGAVMAVNTGVSFVLDTVTVKLWSTFTVPSLTRNTTE